MSTEPDRPATKRDLIDATHEIREFIREREVVSIRWFVTTQIVYFALTLGFLFVLKLSHY